MDIENNIYQLRYVPVKVERKVLRLRKQRQSYSSPLIPPASPQVLPLNPCFVLQVVSSQELDDGAAEFFFCRFPLVARPNKKKQNKNNKKSKRDNPKY